jgi:glycosyltransferase involved in cell wall biosynthesis
MTDSPGVSVVIPTHRRPELMRRALMSVLGQTYQGSIEVLVVFDACEPELPEVSLPARITVSALVNNRTRGLAGARNTGILAASHEFVGFLDDDDYWLPDKLTAQLDLFAVRPRSSMVGTAMLVDAGEARHERLLPGDTITQRELLRDRLAGLHSSSFLFRREHLLDRIGLVDEELPGSYGEDYDLLLRASRTGPISVVNRPLVVVTWQGQSYYFGKWDRYAEALTYLISVHPEFATDRRGLGRVESQIAFAHAAAGAPQDAERWARQALGHDPIRIRAFLALAISRGIIKHDTIVRAAQRVGKGI